MSNSSNTGGYGYDSWSSKQDVWDTFDRLPVRLRRMIHQAPYKVAPEAVAAKLRNFNSEDAVLEWFDDFFARAVPERVRKDYGPDHPAAH